MTTTVMPVPRARFFDANGNPLAGGKIYSYAAGTSTPKATFTDQSGGTPNTNPIILDSHGEANIWLDGAYKIVLADSADVVQWTVDNISESASQADLDALSASVSAATSKIISTNVTLSVPGQYATIDAAMNYLADKVITNGALVTIQVADGTYNLTSVLNLSHQYGGRIRLIGNTGTPANCVLQFNGTSNGIVVSNGGYFGFIDGFTVKLASKAVWPNNITGILAVNGANIILGPNMVVDNFYYGIAAQAGSYIMANYAKVDHAGDAGIWAFTGSMVDANYAQSNNASDTTNSWGYGFQAEYGSAMNCSNASASGCLIGGIASLSNSNVRALNATASNNTGSGFFARDGGTIECHGATCSNNTRYGVEQIGVSRILANTLTMTGNTLGDVKQVAAFDNGSLGPRIDTPNGGSLRLDCGDQHFFHSDNGLQFEIGKGPTNTVNHLYTNGSTSGQELAIVASGSDSVIDFALYPKGAGSYVKLGTGYVATSDTPIVGYVYIKDNTGTVRKLACVA